MHCEWPDYRRLTVIQIAHYLSAWKHRGFAQNSFRLTVLETSECPQALQHFWSGHAHEHVSERYKKLKTNRQFRLDWAERIGLAFSNWPTCPTASSS